MIAGGIGGRKKNASVNSGSSSRGGAGAVGLLDESEKMRGDDDLVGCGLAEEKKLDMVERMVEEAKKRPPAPAGDDGRNGGGSADGGAKDVTSAHKGEEEEEKGVSQRMDRLPDMTGKIITVSAEETIKLTKERKKKGRDSGGGSSTNSGRRKSKGSTPSPSRGSGRGSPSPGSQRPGYEPSNSDRELMADVEREFQDFIAKLGAAKIRGGESQETVGDGSGDDQRAGEEGGAQTPAKPTDDSETNLAVRRSTSHTAQYTLDLDTMIENIDEDISRRRSETYTVDYTVDTWSKADDKTDENGTKHQFTMSEMDTSITAISETRTATESGAHESSTNDFDHSTIPENAPDDDNNLDSTQRTGNRVRSSHRRACQPFQRSSLRRSSNWGAGSESDKSALSNRGHPEYGRQKSGISWASLIDMEKSGSKGDASQQARRKPRGERSNLHGSLISSATFDSKVSSSSPCTKSSCQSKRSQVSKSSAGSGGNKSISWKNETAMGQASNKNPAYIRRQAKERFERGLHFAKRGKYEHARERFLMALRYRVMRRGEPNHPDVAAVHEMLGHVQFFISLEAEIDDEFEVSLAKLDDAGEGGSSARSRDDSMLGWDVSARENDNSKRREKMYEKAAMHYQTVLEILCPNKVGENAKHRPRGSSVSSASENSFDWNDIAESYTRLVRGGEDDEYQLDTEHVMDIVARVQGKLASLPMSTSRQPKSYTSTFLDANGS